MEFPSGQGDGRLGLLVDVETKDVGAGIGAADV
jgi:hypothetical protein